jgi:hypothetical protein
MGLLYMGESIANTEFTIFCFTLCFAGIWNSFLNPAVHFASQGSVLSLLLLDYNPGRFVLNHLNLPLIVG